MTEHKQTIIEVIEKYIKENAMGQVCPCGGGGTDDENKTCKVCGGCGIYQWEIFKIVDFIEKELQSTRTATIQECLEKLPPKKLENHEEIFAHRNGYCKCNYNTALSDVEQSLKELL